MNGSASAPSSAAMNGTPRGHKPGDEGDVAGQPIELGDDDGAAGALGSCQSCRELRPPLQGIGALARLDLDELAYEGKALALAELDDGTTLRFQAQAGATLPSGRQRGCRRSPLRSIDRSQLQFETIHCRSLQPA